jgi:hypothetical protein
MYVLCVWSPVTRHSRGVATDLKRTQNIFVPNDFVNIFFNRGLAPGPVWVEVLYPAGTEGRLVWAHHGTNNVHSCLTPSRTTQSKNL